MVNNFWESEKMKKLLLIGLLGIIISCIMRNFGKSVGNIKLLKS